MYTINKSKNKKINIPLYFLYVYIALIYILPPLNISVSWSSFSMWVMLAVTLISIILNPNKLKILPYYWWYMSLILLALFSAFYAIDSAHTLSSIYIMLVPLGLSLAFCTIIETQKEIKNIIICLSISGFVLFIIILLTNNLQPDERLGQSLFGNTNVFAAIEMIALLSSIWLAISKNAKTKLLYILISFSQIYLLFLSGGRKYILVPLVFLYILFILKKDKKNKSKIIKYTIIFGVILFLGYVVIMNVPKLYDSIGYRMEGFFGVFIGQGNDVTNSDQGRVLMIESGFRYFLQRPIFGWGNNSFMLLFGADTGYYLYSHNNFIELLVNLGLVGFLLYYSFYAYLINKLWKIKNDENSLKEFFLAFIISILFFEIGAITYCYQNIISILIALASLFIFLKGEQTL